MSGSMSEFWAGLITAVVGFVVGWFVRKNPTLPSLPQPVVPPINPNLPTPTPQPNDPFAPLPGLPGHPFLNGLLQLLPLLKLFMGGAQSLPSQPVFGAKADGAHLSQYEDAAVLAIATALKSSPAAADRMKELLDG